MTRQLLFLGLFSACSAFGQQSLPAGMRHFMQATPSPANAIPYGNNPKAGHYVQAGYARIYYEVDGQGKPVLVLHGGGVGSTYEMTQFIDSLSKTYQVIAISTRSTHGEAVVMKMTFVETVGGQSVEQALREGRRTTKPDTHIVKTTKGLMQPIGREVLVLR